MEKNNKIIITCITHVRSEIYGQCNHFLINSISWIVKHHFYSLIKVSFVFNSIRKGHTKGIASVYVKRDLFFSSIDKWYNILIAVCLKLGSRI
jgi:hypothetical protein